MYNYNNVCINCVCITDIGTLYSLWQCDFVQLLCMYCAPNTHGSDIVGHMGTQVSNKGSKMYHTN